MQTSTIDFSDSFWQKNYLLYDSRKLISGKDTLFFAFRGRYQDGHTFIPEMYEKGVRNFVVRQIPNDAPKKFPEATFQAMENPLRCMQALATHHRAKFSIPVVGITGSNGKTIVKEWLYQLLPSHFRIVKSPKSYNSQIGVPLSVWEMKPYHNLGIFEAGISRKNEMLALERIIQPTIGIFTNVGPAHDEGFANRLEKVREKMQLFRHVHTLIYRADYPLIVSEAQTLQHVEHWSWGNSPEALWQFSVIAHGAKHTDIRLKHTVTQVLHTFRLPFTDSASIENAVHCILLMLFLAIDTSTIQERLNQLQNLPMRLELKEGKGSNLLIDDSYSNDALSLRIALDFLAQHRQHRAATLILSDLQQTGQAPEELYPQIAQWLSERNITRLWGVGDEISRFASKFAIPQQAFFPDTEALLQHINHGTPFQGEIVLVKGARSFQFERIVNRLQQKLHGTRLEINLEAIIFNLKFYKSFLKPSTKIMVMVKAFAYGSGSHQIADVLQYQGVDYLAVAYADEGVRLRQKGIRLPIMVMNPLPETYELLLQYNLEPEIYSIRHLESFLTFLKTQHPNHPISIHLKLETGMHRLGFEPTEIEAVTQYIKAYPTLKVATAFSHLAAADTPEEHAFSQIQIQQFQQMALQLEQALGYTITKHMLNSAGIVRYPEHQMDMVRLGIGLYGIEVNQMFPQALQPIGTLKTTISQIKILQPGDTVGYGRYGKAKEPMRIATIAIGYADGFDRRFSQGVGSVLIHGKLAPVIGNVCMDMTMVDVTHIPQAQEEDEVIIFGEGRPVTEVAATIGTIPYEILTNVKDRVRRIFYIA